VNAVTEPITLRGRELLAGGKPVVLKGVNVGNWLNLESFMIGLPSVDHLMRRAFEEILGSERERAFFDTYEDVYFTEKDAAFLAKTGFNFLRIPFNYRRFETDLDPGRYDGRGFALLDQAFAACRAHGIYVLLDFHAVPGSQSEDWHADNPTVHPLFFEVADYQRRAALLWRAIAERYAGEPALFGYDLLNEPNTRHHDRLNAFYRQAIAAIREVDSEHAIVVEGSRFSSEIDTLALDLFDDPRVMPSFHHYPFFGIKAYPSEDDGKRYDRDALLETMVDKFRFYDKVERPMLLGEFGMNTSYPSAGDKVLQDLVMAWEGRALHFTQWSYKDVGQMGLVAPAEDTPWRKFTAELHERRAKASGWREFRKTFFDEYADVPEEKKTLSAKEMWRANDRLAIHRAVSMLESRSADDLSDMAASFRLDQCKVDPTLLGALAPLL
jgi:endoglucanase